MNLENLGNLGRAACITQGLIPKLLKLLKLPNHYQRKFRESSAHNARPLPKLPNNYKGI